MRLQAVSVGQPRDVEDPKRGTVRTSIWKVPVSGPVQVGRTNLAGDAQADLAVHGGVDMAVYAYPAEHYAAWRKELGLEALEPGSFGENLTLEGLTEPDVLVGDRLRIGTALFEVSQPRAPCFKLGLRFGDPGMVRRFQQSGRSGFYLRVIEEGTLSAGDAVQRVAVGEGGMSIAEVNRLWYDAPQDRLGAVRAAALPALAEGWRQSFAERLLKPLSAD